MEDHLKIRQNTPPNPFDEWVRREFGPDSVLQKRQWFASDSILVHIGLETKNYCFNRGIVTDSDGNTFFCVWRFPDCPNVCYALGCVCDMPCMGDGPWGYDNGPCSDVVWDWWRSDAHALDFESDFWKVPIATAWPHLDIREQLATYEVDPGFVYTIMTNAHDWYFAAKKQANEEDGVYREKHARRIRREKGNN